MAKARKIIEFVLHLMKLKESQRRLEDPGGGFSALMKCEWRIRIYEKIAYKLHLILYKLIKFTKEIFIFNEIMPLIISSELLPSPIRNWKMSNYTYIYFFMKT